jgi:F-type H+-transporting ATPase subunit delta
MKTIGASSTTRSPGSARTDGTPNTDDREGVMRAHEGTARRYAKALHLIARETGTMPAVGDELARFLERFEGDAHLHDVLTRPWIKGVDRRAIAVAVAEGEGCGALVRDFVGLLAERGRMDHFTEIMASYRNFVDEDLGQARATVRTAAPLTDPEKRELGRRLEGALGTRILLEERVDPTLLGGFVAQVGSYIVDGSLDGQLARMRERLARG